MIPRPFVLTMGPQTQPTPATNALARSPPKPIFPCRTALMPLGGPCVLRAALAPKGDIVFPRDLGEEGLEIREFQHSPGSYKDGWGFSRVAP